MTFESSVSELRDRVDNQLDAYLSTATSVERLSEAMRYSSFNGGKRLRPFLVYASCMALGGSLSSADPAAAAVEMVHAYSLIHDDLPAMDDDELRRGKPTCHIAFDEATAILAGDALQSLAFEVLSLPSATVTPALQIEMLCYLAKASGDKGMVAGQSIDMQATGAGLSLDELEQMHSLKTGALICASVRLGALASGVAENEQLMALDNYARAIGLAFQVQDDILDIESDTATLGKAQGADLALGKSTYPALLGLSSSKEKLANLHQQALGALKDFDSKADLLRQLADFIVERNH